MACHRRATCHRKCHSAFDRQPCRRRAFHSISEAPCRHQAHRHICILRSRQRRCSRRLRLCNRLPAMAMGRCSRSPAASSHCQVCVLTGPQSDCNMRLKVSGRSFVVTFLLAIIGAHSGLLQQQQHSGHHPQQQPSGPPQQQPGGPAQQPQQPSPASLTAQPAHQQQTDALLQQRGAPPQQVQVPPQALPPAGPDMQLVWPHEQYCMVSVCPDFSSPRTCPWLTSPHINRGRILQYTWPPNLINFLKPAAGGEQSTAPAVSKAARTRAGASSAACCCRDATYTGNRQAHKKRTIVCRAVAHMCSRVGVTESPRCPK